MHQVGYVRAEQGRYSGIRKGRAGQVQFHLPEGVQAQHTRSHTAALHSGFPLCSSPVWFSTKQGQLYLWSGDFTTIIFRDIIIESKKRSTKKIYDFL